MKNSVLRLQGFKVWDLEFGVMGLGCRVWDLGFECQGSG